MEELKLHVDRDSLYDLIYGMEDLCEGFYLYDFSYTEKGIREMDRRNSEDMNVDIWFGQNYRKLQGTLRMIAAASRIIGEAITNDELEFTQKGDNQNETK